MRGYLPEELYQQIHKTMPIVCVDVVVQRCGNTEILLLKRAIEPLAGEWFFPGGRLQKNEKGKDAAIRIVDNEAGLPLSNLCFLGCDETFYPSDPFGHGLGTHTVNLVFFGSSLGDARIDCRHTGFQWLPEEQVNELHPYLKKWIGKVH